MQKTMETELIKQLIETLFLAITMCTGFTTDGTCMNTMRAVSLAKHLRAVADEFFGILCHSVSAKVSTYACVVKKGII